MSGVNETLQQLVERRLREMGKERGRGEPLSLHEAWESAPEPKPTYEVFRRIRVEGHTSITGRTVRTLATMLAVDPSVVSTAAGQRPAREPFVLPEYAAKLESSERLVVLGVIDAIIAAGERQEQHRGNTAPTNPAGESPAPVPDDGKRPLTDDELAARRKRDNEAAARAAQKAARTGERDPGDEDD